MAIDLPGSESLEDMSVDEVFVFPVGQGVIVHKTGVRLHTGWLLSRLQVRRPLRTDDLEEKVAKLLSVGQEAHYTRGKVEGPFKGGHCRYGAVRSLQAQMALKA